MTDNIDRVNAETMQNLTGKDRENFERGLSNLGMTNPVDRDTLRASFKRSNPEWTDAQLEIAVTGEIPQDNRREWIA